MRKGWRKAPLGELVTESNERAGARTELPVLSVTKNRGVMLASERFGKPLHGRNLSKYRLARRGQLAVDPMLLWDGSLGLQRVVEAGLVSPDYRVFDAAEGVDPDFLEALLRSDVMRPHFQSGARGTNVRRNRIARGDFLAIEATIPPLEEQLRIATVLSAIEATAARVATTGVAADRMLDALLERFFSGSASGHTKPAPWGEVPVHWHVRRCDEVFEIRLGKMMNAAARLGTCAVPYLRNQNVYWGRFDLSDVATMDIAEEDRGRFVVRRGDILACEGRFIGRSAVWEGGEPIYYQKALHRLRARDHGLNPYFMQFFMEFRFRLRQDLAREAQATSTIPHFPLERMVKLEIPVPPREEQDELVRLLRGVRARAAAERELLQQQMNAKRELATALFSGGV